MSNPPDDRLRLVAHRVLAKQPMDYEGRRMLEHGKYRELANRNFELARKFAVWWVVILPLSLIPLAMCSWMGRPDDSGDVLGRIVYAFIGLSSAGQCALVAYRYGVEKALKRAIDALLDEAERTAASVPESPRAPEPTARGSGPLVAAGR